MHENTGGLLALMLATLAAAPSALAAEEGRFDAQVFRPLAAPRDLVMVPKSEVLEHLSPTAGLYWDVAFDPLTLAFGGTSKTLDVVGARLQITPLLGVGLFHRVELTAAIPLVAWQTSDNLRAIGSEGSVRSTPHVGDIRLQTKVALPWLERGDAPSGIGMALAGNINLPTGDPLAFSSDGALSGGAQVVVDYRFGFGLLLASNLGIWVRPEHQFAGVKIGDMAQFGLAGEMYVVQRWGLSVIGEVYGYPSLTAFPDGPDQVPAEVLLGVRWQTRQGITITVGGSFGAACGFGAPAVRLFNSITWQPKSSAEQAAITRIQERDGPDRDHDGVLDTADRCPAAVGPPERFGCPADAPTQSPVLVAAPERRAPQTARIEGDLLVTPVPIQFAPDSAEPLEASLPMLEGVFVVLAETPTIAELRIEGHTDVREADGDPQDSRILSMVRGMKVMQWLVRRGIPKGRLGVVGFGHRDPEFDDATCTVAREGMPLGCAGALEGNRRVVFRIVRRKAASSGALLPDCRPFVKDGQPPVPCVLPVKSEGLPRRLGRSPQ